MAELKTVDILRRDMVALDDISATEWRGSDESTMSSIRRCTR